MTANAIGLLSDYLETYSGRDKLLRTLSYAAKLASGFPSSARTSNNFKKFSSELSGCRVILRLLDDIPAIHSALTYDYKRRESDWLIKFSEILQVAVDLMYGPIEHITWAGEKGFIKINVDKWEKFSVWFWLFSIYLALLKSSRKFSKFNKLENSSMKSDFDASKTTRKQLNKLKSNELLTSMRLILDMSFAISYLPKGTLWGGKLKPWQVGALGTASSLIGLYQALSKRASNK